MSTKAIFKLSPALVLLAILLDGISPLSAAKKSEATASPRPAVVLLVTSESLADAWQKFADWKTRGGKPTKIVAVEEIAKGYKGDDIQQKIRACVQEHINKHGTRWVILGGDSQPGGKGLVPDRDTPHPQLGYEDIPTDLYYISPKNWDADGDGIYGEWKDDRESIAYTGPACIGRIPLRSPQQVADYTEKVIGYETRYPGRKFATNFTYTCSVTYANYKSDMYWDKYLSKEWKAGHCDKFFVNKTPWDKEKPGDYDLSAENWAEQINKRNFGKMHMHGHGLLKLWALEGRSRADTKNVEQLKNEDAYLVMTTVSCFTGHFDSPGDPSIAEKMLRLPKAGAVVVCAPSRPGVPIFHDGYRDPRDGKTQDGTTRTYTRFWINGLSKNLTTGEAFAAAKSDLAADARKTAGYHWCQCELNLLGDPTLDMRASEVTSLKVTAPSAITTKTDSVKIAAGRAAVTVCLWKGEEVYATAVTDSTGNIEVPVKLKTAGKLLLTVSGPSVNTFVGQIEVK